MRFILPCLILAAAFPACAGVSVEIDLSAQKAWLLQDGQPIYESPISSGRSSHPTPAGDFSVSERDADHLSTLYGKIVGGDGSVLDSNASSSTPVPEGAKFVQAPMKWFIRFNGAVGMHAGRLPGYAASHGCVRMPAAKAKLFFDIVEVGTPVRVTGKAPARGTAPTKAKAPPATPPPATPAPKRLFPWFRGGKS